MISGMLNLILQIFKSRSHVILCVKFYFSITLLLCKDGVVYLPCTRTVRTYVLTLIETLNFFATRFHTFIFFLEKNVMVVIVSYYHSSLLFSLPLSSFLSSRFYNDFNFFLSLYLVVTIVCRCITFSDRPLDECVACEE